MGLFSGHNQGFIVSEVSPKQGGSFLELEFAPSLWESPCLQQLGLWLQACQQSFPVFVLDQTYWQALLVHVNTRSKLSTKR